MTVAFDDSSTTTSSDGDMSWAHTPSGTPRGVVVFLASNTTGTPSVTYGGESLAEVTGSPVISSSALANMRDCYAFFLGSGIPTGEQTVAVTSSAGASQKAWALTFTADADTEVLHTQGVDSTGETGDITETLALEGVESAVAEVVSADENLTSGVTPLDGSWLSVDENDHGSFVTGFYLYGPVDTSDVTVGANYSGNDAFAALAVAVSEVSAGGGEAEHRPLMMMGAGG